MSTTTATTPPLTTCQAPVILHPNTENQSLRINQTYGDFFFSRLDFSVFIYHFTHFDRKSSLKNKIVNSVIVYSPPCRWKQV